MDSFEYRVIDIHYYNHEQCICGCSSNNNPPIDAAYIEKWFVNNLGIEIKVIYVGYFVTEMVVDKKDLAIFRLNSR